MSISNTPEVDANGRVGYTVIYKAADPESSRPGKAATRVRQGIGPAGRITEMER